MLFRIPENLMYASVFEYEHVSYSQESRVPVKQNRTLEVCRLKYLKTSRVRHYSDMNTFQTSHESRISVTHFGTRSVLSDCTSR